MIPIPYALSLGSPESSSVLTGYRTESSSDSLFAAVVSLHLDMAEELPDEQLTSLLQNVLLAVPTAGALSSTPSAILQAMHHAALDSGRYFSAAVARRDTWRIDVTRCGLASLLREEMSHGQMLLAPEFLQGDDAPEVLDNALGISWFKLSHDYGAAVGARYFIVVGTKPDSGLPLASKGLPVADHFPRQRGGMALVIQ
ncbi:hypothetical protein [Saccharopolyspora hattusasensis]|uniref:hypothetical protein n=1 Tax=Saccharopolyspora hattusasensis TaxID=1128679 RepID=UPI003D98E94A